MLAWTAVYVAIGLWQKERIRHMGQLLDDIEKLVTRAFTEGRRAEEVGKDIAARYAIDILVRNLFERTADVGFLATDADL